jgi:hypothetical protein
MVVKIWIMVFWVMTTCILTGVSEEHITSICLPNMEVISSSKTVVNTQKTQSKQPTLVNQNTVAADEFIRLTAQVYWIQGSKPCKLFYTFLCFAGHSPVHGTTPDSVPRGASQSDKQPL